MKAKKTTQAHNCPGQPGPGISSGAVVNLGGQKDILLKRARSKFFSFHLSKALADLNSPLAPAYKRSLNCGAIITQTGNRLTSTYCGARWCVICNRIRTGKMINHYQPHLSDMYEPHFITLTIPNIKGNHVDLWAEISHVQKWCRKTFDLLRKYNLRFKGFRKIEVSYNPDENSFHPHLHILTDGFITDFANDELNLKTIWRIWRNRGLNKKRFAVLVNLYNKGKIQAGYFKCELLLQLWLKSFPGAKRVAQDVTQATPGTLKELFKYSAKIITKRKASSTYTWSVEEYTTANGERREIMKRKLSPASMAIYIDALDTIYRALYRKRVFQPIGYDKAELKYFNEMLDGNIQDDLQAVEFTTLNPDESTAYVWTGNDWQEIINGQRLTGFVPVDIDKRRVDAFVYIDSG